MKQHSCIVTRVVCVLCVATGFSSGVLSAYANEKKSQLLRCEKRTRICIASISPLLDSDGDGVADIDESFLKTDVLNDLSVPTVKAQLDAAFMMKLPSMNVGLSYILVLPTQFPDGTKIGGDAVKLGPLEAAQANLDWPARADRLSGLGIKPDLLKSMGIDTGNGFSIGIGNLRGGGGKAAPAGLDVALAQINSAQYSDGAGGDDLTAIPMPLFNANGFDSSKATNGYGDSENYHQNFAGGGYTETTVQPESSNVGYFDKDGKEVASRNGSKTEHEHSDGSSHSNESQETRVLDSNGGVNSIEKDHQEHRDANGNITSTSDGETHIYTRSDGSQSESSIRINSVQSADGGQTQTTTIAQTERDSSGQVTSHTEQKTVTDYNKDGSQKESKTTCAGDSCPASQYIDPDAQQAGNVAVTPAQMKQILVKLGRNRDPKDSNPDDTVELPHGFAGDPKGTNPLVLIDPEGQVRVVLTVPHFFNSPKGTENFGPPGSQPTITSDGGLGGGGTTFVNELNILHP